MRFENGRYSLSSREMRWVTATSWLTATLMFSLTLVVVARLTNIPPAIGFSLALLAFSVPLFVPMRARLAQRKVDLSVVRYTTASILGAIVGGAAHLLLTAIW